MQYTIAIYSILYGCCTPALFVAWAGRTYCPITFSLNARFLLCRSTQCTLTHFYVSNYKTIDH